MKTGAQKDFVVGAGILFFIMAGMYLLALITAGISWTALIGSGAGLAAAVGVRLFFYWAERRPQAPGDGRHTPQVIDATLPISLGVIGASVLTVVMRTFVSADGRLLFALFAGMSGTLVMGYCWWFEFQSRQRRRTEENAAGRWRRRTGSRADADRDKPWRG